MAEFLEGPLWQKVIAVILMVVLIAWGSYNFLYKPKVQEIKDFKKALELTEKEIEVHTPEKIVLEKGVKRSDILKEEIRLLEKKIPTEANIPMMLKEFIFEAGKGLDIQYQLFQPQTPVKEKEYKRVPIKLDFLCTYADLNLYLIQIEDLPTIIRVDKLDLKKQEDEKIKVSLTLSAFVLPGGEVAEREEVAPIGFYDPFFPTEAGLPPEVLQEVAGPWNLQLEGIWKGKEVKALINGKFAKVGDSIEGYKIVHISKSNVTVLKAGEKYTLELEAD